MGAACFAAAVAWVSLGQGAPVPPWQSGPVDGTIATRFPPPPGFARLAAAPGTFAAWLQALPVQPGRGEVHLFDGRLKANQQAQAAVLAVEVGAVDLQQCADAVMRLRAEYLRDSGRADEVCFRFTSGHPASFAQWRQGFRPRVQGAKVSWQRTAAADASYKSFRAYLDVVFTYAGSASLARELVAVPAGQITVGDVLIQGGHPGHAVLVIDVAESSTGERLVLLAQSYMPAQQVHVLVNPDRDSSPWYRVTGERVDTPEWGFTWRDLRRFPIKACP